MNHFIGKHSATQDLKCRENQSTINMKTSETKYVKRNMPLSGINTLKGGLTSGRQIQSTLYLVFDLQKKRNGESLQFEETFLSKS